MIAIAAGVSASSYDADITGGGHSIALTADKRVWTWGDNEFGELGRNTGTFDPSPGLVTALTNQNVAAIAGGLGFTLAVTSNGQVYAWGSNSTGQLGTNTGGAAVSAPTRVAGISNAVWVSAPVTADPNDPDVYNGAQSLAVTVNQGTNQYFAWAENVSGQVGNGTNASPVYAPAGPLPFVHLNPCVGCIQLGTSNVFTAQVSGTLVLYFNDCNFSDNSGAYTAAVSGVTSGPVVVQAINSAGTVAGAVTNGGVYTCTASGFCNNQVSGDPNYDTDADGKDHLENLQSCTGCEEPFVCTSPSKQCFSLVGKIE